MEWTDDKILHYRIGYKFGRYGSVFGLLIISIILAHVKEICDLIRNKIFNKKYYFEINDYISSVIGAFYGMLFEKKKY